MKLEDCFIGQKVGLHYDGEVLTGVIEDLDGNIATVYLSGMGSGNEVDVKYLLGVVSQYQLGIVSQNQQKVVKYEN